MADEEKWSLVIKPKRKLFDLQIRELLHYRDLLFLFVKLANIGTDGIPYVLFYYSGIILWGFFIGCFMDSSNVFVNNVGVLKFRF